MNLVLELSDEKGLDDNSSPNMNDDLDSAINSALDEHSDGSMCVGSSTGEIHGLAGRLAAIRENSGISMCFWGAFGK
jgi:hypothetical protein